VARFKARQGVSVYTATAEREKTMGDVVESHPFFTAARSELPGDLRCLVFVYDWLRNGKPRTTPYEMEKEDDDDENSWADQMIEVFNLIGFAAIIPPDPLTPKAAEYRPVDFQSINGTPNGKIVFAIIGTTELLKKWLGTWSGEYDLGELHFKAWGKHFLGDDVRKIKLSSLASFFDYYMSVLDWEVEELSWKGVDAFNFAYDEGDFAGWLAKAQATDEDFAKLAALVAASEGRIEKMHAAIRRNKESCDLGATSFLVPGLIPQGSVTLLLGKHKVGKSALGLELAVTTARREAEWAGFKLAPRGGYAVYLAGEDTPQETLARVRQMTGGDMPYTLWIEGSSDLETILEKLRGENIALLVVDPARKYFQGDEDGSDAVSALFTRLEDFAREKNAAVVVTHHLRRNATVKNVHDVANYYRGSGVFLDRPRVTLAVHLGNNETHLAIPVSDRTPLHNFSQSEMFAGVRRLRRDEESFRHVAIDVQQPSATPASDADTERVLAAARGVIESGEPRS
jgi:hypothetical protein